MKIVIIEDEAYAADALVTLILKIRPEAEIIARLPSVEEAVDWFQLNELPELLFCDIHLSDGSSFEIFKQVEVKCPVIFTTAYDQYAIEAFKVNSVDYLLKPVRQEEVIRAVRKYESLRQEQLTLDVQKMEQFFQSTKQEKRNPERKSRFKVRSGQSLKVIPEEEIAYFLAEEGVVFLVCFQGQRYIVDHTLEELEQQLDKFSYFRANRQLITNIDAVKEVKPYFKGRLYLVLDPPPKNDQIISNSKASAFKDWLGM